jgi:hypothetical protein
MVVKKKTKKKFNIGEWSRANAKKRKPAAKKRVAKKSVKRPRKASSSSKMESVLNRLTSTLKRSQKAMPTKRKAKKVARKRPRTVVVHAAAPVTRKRRRKSSVARHTTGTRKAKRSIRSRIAGAGKKFTMKNMFMDGAAGAVAAVGSAYLTNAIPLPSSVSRFKGAIPLALAVLVGTKGKKLPHSTGITVGLATVGILSIVKQFVPNLPLLSGVMTAPAPRLARPVSMARPITMLSGSGNTGHVGYTAAHQISKAPGRVTV